MCPYPSPVFVSVDDLIVNNSVYDSTFLVFGASSAVKTRIGSIRPQTQICGTQQPTTQAFPRLG